MFCHAQLALSAVHLGFSEALHCNLDLTVTHYHFIIGGTVVILLLPQLALQLLNGGFE